MDDLVYVICFDKIKAEAIIKRRINELYNEVLECITIKEKNEVA